VTGYARNLPDGTVEVVAQAADPGVLSRLEALLASGPDHAKVDAVEREDLSDPEFPITRSFDIR
jgi:acylphosphatase